MTGTRQTMLDMYFSVQGHSRTSTKELEDWSTGAIHGLCQAVCEEYSWLNTENIAVGKNVWRVKPKFHMFQEMAQVQNLELRNPLVFGSTKMRTL